MQMNQSLPSTHKPYDLCIMGGGAVGMVALLMAHQQGLNAVQAVSQSTPGATPSTTGVPRTYAIAPKVQNGLARLGVWGLLKDHQIMRCKDMRIFWQTEADQASAQNSSQTPIHFSAAQAHMSELCSFVAEDDLITALNAAMLAAFGPTPPTTVNEATPAKLRIVAQGANSPAAAQLGLAPTVYDYGHSAVVAVLHSEQSLTHTAFQWLGCAQQGHDVLALLPLPTLHTLPEQPRQGSRYGLVWSQPTKQAQQWLEKHHGEHVTQGEPYQALLNAINQRCASTVGRLSLHSAVQGFPLYQSTAPSYIGDRVALVGDTAHKIHPLAGQGLNLGFEDVFTLFEILAQREVWRSIDDPRLLARYQRQRRAHADPVSQVIHAIARRGDWPQAAQSLWHNGLNTTNHWPKLGAWATRQVVRRMANLSN